MELIKNKFLNPFIFCLGLINVSIYSWASSEISVNVKEEGLVEFDGSSAPFKDSPNSVDVLLRLSCSHANTRTYNNMLGGRTLIVPVIRLTTSNQSVVWKGFDSTNPDVSKRDRVPSDFFQNPSKFIPSWFARPNTCYRRKKCNNDQTSSNLKFVCTGKGCPTGNSASVIGEAYNGSQSTSGVVKLKIPISLEMAQAAKTNWLLNGTNLGISLSFYQVSLTRSCPWYNKNCQRYSRFVSRGAAVDYTLGKADWNGTQYYQTVNFMGGYCGTYTSPLILYFDDKKPNFTGIADNSFVSPGDSIYWPEKNSNAYFLSIDKNKNKIIDSEDELFGSNGMAENNNGFDILKKLDTNNDNIIDSKDNEFKNLLLWKDSTGVGTSLPQDVIPISKMGITKISLKYKTLLIPFGARAKEKQHADFEFVKNNKTQNGKIVDVWFGQVGG